MALIPLDEFRSDVVHVAADRCERLRVEIAEAESALKTELESLNFDDTKAAKLQLRLEDLARDLRIWERRLSWASGRENAQSGGRVEVR